MAMTDRTELGASVFLGVLTHLAIQPLELEKYGWRVCGLYAVVNGALLCNYIAIGDMSVLAGIFRTVMVASGFLIGLVTSMVVYRGFFHRLCRFRARFRPESPRPTRWAWRSRTSNSASITAKSTRNTATLFASVREQPVGERGGAGGFSEKEKC